MQNKLDPHELSILWFERAVAGAAELCREPMDDAIASELTAEQIEGYAVKADEIALNFRTSALLGTIIPCPGTCPSCGYDLVNDPHHYHRPVKAEKRDKSIPIDGVW